MYAEKPLPKTMSVTSLMPFGARSLAGLAMRPKLLNPKAVFRELATQAVTFQKLFEVGRPHINHWKWPPRYVGLPPAAWDGRALELMKTVGPKRRINFKRKQEESNTGTREMTKEIITQESGNGQNKEMKRYRINGKRKAIQQDCGKGQSKKARTSNDMEQPRHSRRGSASKSKGKAKTERASNRISK